MNEENKNKNSKTKDSSLLVIILIIFVIIFVGWLFFIRLNFQEIDNRFKVESNKTTDQAIEDLEQGLREFGSIFESEEGETQPEESEETTETTPQPTTTN